jgi:hypothetical protein
MKTVVLYERDGCCLCEEAFEVLERTRKRNPGVFVIERRDIESDDALLRRYLERIPVIEIDGSEAFELLVDESELGQCLGIVRAR